jgi:hypothetical protein
LLISPYPKGKEYRRGGGGLDKTELYVLATLNTYKVLEEGFEYKDRF